MAREMDGAIASSNQTALAVPNISAIMMSTKFKRQHQHQLHRQRRRHHRRQRLRSIVWMTLLVGSACPERAVLHMQCFNFAQSLEATAQIGYRVMAPSQIGRKMGTTLRQHAATAVVDAYLRLLQSWNVRTTPKTGQAVLEQLVLFMARACFAPSLEATDLGGIACGARLQIGRSMGMTLQQYVASAVGVRGSQHQYHH